MDSREASGAPPPQQAQQPPPPPGIMLGHHHYHGPYNPVPQPPPSAAVSKPLESLNSVGNSAPPIITPISSSSSAMIPNSRFPFNPVPQQPPSAAVSKPLESLNSPPFDGSSHLEPGFNIDSSSGKKKRGRPRKYAPDGNIALGLAPAPIPSLDQADSGGGGAASSDPQVRKHRGRPPGSGKKQLDALGSAGVGFTPHVIMVKSGEDIASKIMAFSQQGPRTVCILSANGAVCNVSLRQPATSGGTVSYEGRFEIISLSGSYLLSESNGSRSRTGGLSVSLAGSDGRVLGGGVAGMLLAATPVQVVVGSFIADGKKSSSNLSKSVPTSGTPPQMLNFGAQMAGAGSPPSQGALSESSDENGDSPTNHGSGAYNNVSQPIHGMPMYGNMGWQNNTMKMLPN